MRIPRFDIIYENAIVHMTWQCHNNDFLLKEPWAKQRLYDLMLENKNQYGIKVYAYILMDSHPHFILQISDMVESSRFMQKVHSSFATYYNNQMNRRGQVVMDRPKTPVIENDQYLNNVMLYLDLNPVSTKKPVHPKDCEFTSYHYYAFGKEDPLIDPSPAYLALGENDKIRREIYFKMVEDLITLHLENKIDLESFEETVCFLGSPEFVVKKHKELLERLKMRKVKRGEKRDFDKPWNCR